MGTVLFLDSPGPRYMTGKDITWALVSGEVGTGIPWLIGSLTIGKWRFIHQKWRFYIVLYGKITGILVGYTLWL